MKQNERKTVAQLLLLKMVIFEALSKLIRLWMNLVWDKINLIIGYILCIFHFKKIHCNINLY